MSLVVPHCHNHDKPFKKYMFNLQKVGHMHDQDRQQKWVPQYDHNGL